MILRDALVDNLELYESKSHKILSESVWRQLDEDTKNYVNRWEQELWPLLEEYEQLTEAEFTADQILGIFGQAEKFALDSGKYQTIAGKAGEKAAQAGKAAVGGVKLASGVVSQINNKINELGKMIQDTTPVNNIDAAFEKSKKDLTTALGGKDSKIVATVNKLSELAKEHPGKAKFAVALLTTAAAFAGGPAGGAAAGFVLRAGNELLAGEQLSTAVGKSAKTAAVGAVIGKGLDVIGELVPPDVQDVIIASDGQTVDVSGLEAMSATSIEGLEPDAVEDLLKTQNALETAFRSSEGDAQDMIGAELEKVSQKIGELGGVDELQDYAGLEGQDLERTTSTRIGGEVERVPAESISAEELNAAGINFDAEPDISSEVVGWAEDNGIDPEQLQDYFQMEKAMDDAGFIGTDISASNEVTSAYTGDTPVLDTTEFDGTEIQVGKKITSDISTSVGGIDPPISFSSTVSIQGVDPAGNPVFRVEDVFTSPSHPIWDQIADADLSPEARDQLFQFKNEYTGVGVDSKADVEQIVDTFKQTLAKSIGAAATVAAFSRELQDKKVVEGINYDLIYTKHLAGLPLNESEQQVVNEIGLADIKKFANNAAAKVGDAAKKAGGAIAGGAKAAAKEIGNQITVKKLNDLWGRSGKPTDAQSVSNILAKAGMEPGDVTQVSTALPAPTAQQQAQGAQTGAGRPGIQRPQAGEQPAQPAQQPAKQAPAQGGAQGTPAPKTGAQGTTSGAAPQKKGGNAVTRGVQQAQGKEQPSIPKNAKQKINDIMFTWDQAQGEWLDPNGVAATGAMKAELMKKHDLDVTGKSPERGIVQRAKDYMSGKTPGLAQKTRGEPGSVFRKAAGVAGAAIGGALAGGKPAQQQPAPGGEQPAPAPAPAPSGEQPAPQQGKEKKPGQFKQTHIPGSKGETTDDPYELAKQALRKEQDADANKKQLPGGKLPPAAGQKVSQMLDQLSKGNKDAGAIAGRQIMAYAKQGYDVSNAAQVFLAKAKQGERFLNQESYQYWTEMLESYGLTWSDIGLTVRVDEGVSDGVFIISSDLLRMKDLAGV